MKKGRWECLSDAVCVWMDVVEIKLPRMIKSYFEVSR